MKITRGRVLEHAHLKASNPTQPNCNETATKHRQPSADTVKCVVTGPVSISNPFSRSHNLAANSGESKAQISPSQSDTESGSDQWCYQRPQILLIAACQRQLISHQVGEPLQVHDENTRFGTRKVAATTLASHLASLGASGTTHHR
jgi:hypothetical protein